MRVVISLLASLLVCTACSGVAAKPEATLGDVPSTGPVGRTIKANGGRFAACGRDSVTIQTGTVQRIDLRFTIDQNGQVLKARIDSMTDPDPDLHVCILKVLKKLQFPPTSDQKTKELKYPLVLRADS